MVNQWIANIVGVVVLGIFMDMIIPAGNTKSYTRFFMGLIILLAILQPITRLLKQLPAYSHRVWSANIAPELAKIETKAQSLEISHREYLLELYKARLEEDVILRAKEYISDSEINASVSLVDHNREGIFDIYSIRISLGPSSPYKISPVDIGVKIEKNKGDPALDEKDKDKGYDILKKHLSETYEIDESRIYID